MSMTRREALAATVGGGLFLTGAAHAAEKFTPDHAARLSAGERRLLEKAGPTIVKTFIAALRKRFNDENAGELREFIDPRYRKEHKLQAGKFPIRTVLTEVIYDLQISDDPQTLVSIAKTEDAAKEAARAGAYGIDRGLRLSAHRL